MTIPQSSRVPIAVGLIGVAISTAIGGYYEGAIGCLQSLSGALVSAIGIGMLSLLVSMMAAEPESRIRKFLGLSLLFLKLPAMILLIYLGTWSRGAGLYTFFLSIALVYCASIWALATNREG